MACNLFRWQVAIFGCSKVKIVLCTNPRTETIFGANVAQNMVHLIEELFSLTSHIYPEIYKKTCIVNKPNFKPNIEYVDSSRKIFRHYQVLVFLYIRFLIFKKRKCTFSSIMTFECVKFLVKLKTSFHEGCTSLTFCKNHICNLRIMSKGKWDKSNFYSKINKNPHSHVGKYCLRVYSQA